VLIEGRRARFKAIREPASRRPNGIRQSSPPEPGDAGRCPTISGAAAWALPASKASGGAEAPACRSCPYRAFGRVQSKAKGDGMTCGHTRGPLVLQLAKTGIQVFDPPTGPPRVGLGPGADQTPAITSNGRALRPGGLKLAVPPLTQGQGSSSARSDRHRLRPRRLPPIYRQNRPKK